MLQVLLANFLSLGGVQVEFIKARMQQLIGAYDRLFELSESFREFELLDVSQRAGGRRRSPDMRRCLEELHVCEFYDNEWDEKK